MTGFVERLVARGAGQAARQGFVMLESRPAARFEAASATVSGTDHLVQDETVQVRGVRAPSGSPTTPSAHDTMADRETPVRRGDEGGGTAIQPAHGAPRSDFAAREIVLGQDSAVARNAREGPELSLFPQRGPDRERPTVSGARSGEETSETSTESERTTTVIGPESPRIERRRDQEARSRPDEIGSVLTYSEQLVQAANARKSSDEPPAISIGKIEVRFIEPQPPVTAARQAPQRTRGFDAYARARRGEPR